MIRQPIMSHIHVHLHFQKSRKKGFRRMANLEEDFNLQIMRTLGDYIDDSHKTALEHGWWEGDTPSNPRNFPEQLALMHSELSEVLEEYRVDGLDENKFIYYNETKPGKPEGVAVEFADLLIRVFDTCGRYNIPLEKALIEKMKYNESRPYRHGGKKA